MNKFHVMAVAIFLWGFLFSVHRSIAQTDTISVIRKTLPSDSLRGAAYPLKIPDTVQVKKTGKKEWSRPKKALVWALVLPGAGQAYNRKYWKMPILYAGAAACAYFWITNQQGYSELKRTYDYNYDEQQKNPTHVIFEDNLKYGTVKVYTSLAQLSSDRDTYRRYRDLSIAGSVALYALSVLDAYVDAHLREFDLSPDLSFSAKPLFYNYNNATFAPGILLSFKFKDNRIQQSQLYQRSFFTE